MPLPVAIVSVYCIHYPIMQAGVKIKREKKRQEKLRKIKQKQPAIPPEEILVHREAAVIDQFRSWSSCTVPLTVVANKEIYADGHEKLRNRFAKSFSNR